MMKSCTITKYTIGASQFRMLRKDAVIVAYPASMELDCSAVSGPPLLTSDIVVSSTWIKRDGKWMLAAHTGAAKAAPQTQSAP